jgi:hypothetical protein
VTALGTGLGLQGVLVRGGILPPDLLAQVQAGPQGGLPGLTGADYHLLPGETVRDAASRAFPYLVEAWQEFERARARLPEGDPAVALTRERWTLPLLRMLDYGRVPVAPPGGFDVDGRGYPVSHAWEHVPMHLLGPGVTLDGRNPGVPGAARPPQAMLQEVLNHSPEHLWGLLSDGRTIRLLRDSSSLLGSSFVEFDCAAIFGGELFAEFLLLYALLHQSRFERLGGPDAPPADCWLERWRDAAVESGTRALDRLRGGVETALTALGTGFLSANPPLRDQLARGERTTEEFHRGLLRLAYRLLFLFVVEDRGDLLTGDDEAARARYNAHYSTARLRRLSRVRAGSPHTDLWHGLRLVLRGLGRHADDDGTGTGVPALALPGLGGLFDGPAGDLGLDPGLDLPNPALLRAVRALSYVREPGRPVQPVDYQHLGAEELGSIYESLLELVPHVDLDTRTYSLLAAAGNERKTSGSYYTPTSLIELLLDTALDPLLDRAVKDAADAARAEANLLALTVCDPACGSGHFLVAAARRIARRLAEVRTGEPEPPYDAVRSAMADVVGHCLYGVDLNELAAELAKVSLWLEAVQPGRPLSFLGARIRHGNALLGTTPALLEAGVPDEAFGPLVGDDRKVATAVKRRNRFERESGQQGFSFGGDTGNTELARQRRAIEAMPAATADDVRAQADALAELERSRELLAARRRADAWCAAFVWPLTDGAPPPTYDLVAGLADATGTLPGDTAAEVDRLAASLRFFHWHLEFPEVFGVPDDAGTAGPQGWTGGFDCVLGNPPWEHTELKEQEFFASRAPDIATAPGARRKALIAALSKNDPLWLDYFTALRAADAVGLFARSSGRFPFCGRGRINTYALFAETDRTLLAPTGRAGVVLPTGIATDATTQYFFRDVVERRSLAALYDFENGKPLFKGVHRSFKFCTLVLTGLDLPEPAADFAFFLRDPAELATAGTSFALTPEEITLLNPNTGTCPVFRTRRDAEITLGIYRRVPVLLREGDPDGNPWGLSFMQGLFNMTSDSHLFRTREQLEADGWVLRGNVFERASGGG